MSKASAKKKKPAAVNVVRERLAAQKGLASKLAEHLGLASRSSVAMWQRVPAKHVPAVSKFLRIARHRIRPDLYAKR